MMFLSIRNHYGLSQQSLALLLGVSRGYINGVENETYNASERIKRQCYALFNVDEAIIAQQERTKRKEALLIDGE